MDVPGEKGLLAAISTGPVSVNVEADKPGWQLYKKGVFDSPNCGRRTDHAVLAVGWGTSTNASNASMPYYKVKNSWSDSWGEGGYIRLVRGKDMCGIGSSASYPTGAKPFVRPTPAPPTPPTPPTPHTPAPTPPLGGCVGEPPAWCHNLPPTEPFANCSGSSSLRPEQCVAFQRFFDAAGGESWHGCSDKRSDPCSCHDGQGIAYCSADGDLESM